MERGNRTCCVNAKHCSMKAQFQFPCLESAIPGNLSKTGASCFSSSFSCLNGSNDPKVPILTISSIMILSNYRNLELQSKLTINKIKNPNRKKHNFTKRFIHLSYQKKVLKKIEQHQCTPTSTDKNFLEIYIHLIIFLSFTHCNPELQQLPKTAHRSPPATLLE